MVYRDIQFAVDTHKFCGNEFNTSVDPLVSNIDVTSGTACSCYSDSQLNLTFVGRDIPLCQLRT